MSGDRGPIPPHSVIAPVWGRSANVDVERGEGSWLIDRNGERWLDYTSGIGDVNTGHAHPKVAAAIAEQANVAKEQARANAKVARAEGEAKAAQILGEALRQNPQTLEKLKLERWDGALPRVTTGGNTPIMINP